jgi:hypothetical protein
MWIGTQAGLVRFDGVRFVPWTPPDGKHLPSSSVTSVFGRVRWEFVDRDGRWREPLGQAASNQLPDQAGTHQFHY